MILEYDEVIKILSDTLSIPEGSIVFKGDSGNLCVEIKTGDFSVCKYSSLTGKVLDRKSVHISDRLAKPIKHKMSGLTNNEQWIECTCCGSSNRLGFTGEYPKYCSNCGSRFVYGEQ